LYGIDLDDRSVYDLIIDATNESAESVAMSIAVVASK
jgi:cytidylate kinase